MISAFDLTKTYHAGEFQCNKCDHITVIFINTCYSMFGFGLSDKTCCICKTEHTHVSDADLILRYDWPDADDYPWQLQGATMHDGNRYCTKCRSKVKRDWKKFIVPCSKCDGYMEFQAP